MVHSFEKLGYYFIIDSESGSLYRVDEAAFLAAKKRYETLTNEESARIQAFGVDEIRKIDVDFDALEKEKTLNSCFEQTQKKIENHGVIKALCLNICHDCNLRCKYCFADEGKYNGARGKMSVETACAALGFLVKASGNRHNLEVDFFGGEPLMNFDVVRQTVAYGRELEKSTGKSFHFTITTNATNLKDDDVEFINREMKNVVLSIDGRKEIHDAVRPNAAGKGSFNAALSGAKKLRAVRGNREYYVRGTYTCRNLDFSKDAVAIADLGFDQLSLEPVVLPPEHELALKEEQLPVLKQEYRRLAKIYEERLGTDRAFNFFHFNIDLGGGPCERKRLTGCGAGVEYAAVADNGDLYPCHQFVGEEAYKMGTIWDGVTRPEIGDRFCGVNINTKSDCKKCWARYYCSGGCNANAVHFSGDIFQPMRLMCELSRERIECALALRALRDGKSE